MFEELKESTKAIILTIIILFVVALGGIGWKLTIGKWDKAADREIFKQSTTYSEGAASFLADCYKQYNDAETQEDKNSIMEYVMMRYPNLDTKSIDNDILRRFYISCMSN